MNEESPVYWVGSKTPRGDRHGMSLNTGKEILSSIVDFIYRRSYFLLFRHVLGHSNENKVGMRQSSNIVLQPKSGHRKGREPTYQSSYYQYGQYSMNHSTFLNRQSLLHSQKLLPE